MGQGKLSDIRETTSDAAEIVRQLATPGVRESLDKAKEIADTAKEIMEILRTPEWVRNIENLGKMAEKMPDFSATSDGSALGNASALIQSARKLMDNLVKDEGGLKGQDLKELSTSVKEMIESFKALADELTLAAADSNRSGPLQNTKEAASSLSGAYRTVKGA